MDANVSNLLSSSGDWNWKLLRLYFPRNILDYIRASTPPCANFGTDMCCWKFNSNGKFTVQLAYRNIS